MVLFKIMKYVSMTNASMNKSGLLLTRFSAACQGIYLQATKKTER